MIDLTALHNNSLFGGITEDEIEKIRHFFQVEKFTKGQFIEKEGKEGDRIYFIVQGSVEILKALTHKEKNRRITVLKEGDTFGEMELIDVQPCAASVRALEDTTTLTLTNRGLYEVSKTNLKTFSLLIMNLAREISRRLRKMDDFFAEKCF
ncbi:MAG: cyclic nucleotide-binding domain-containing protein [Spirochaetales bacterium]|nr:cyclic nucleotide-binding domain-containing protein [Spirochaetales bacterium]